MRSHHKQTHGESLAKITVECEGCGSTLERQQWELNESDRHFCDNRCQRDWQKRKSPPVDQDQLKEGLCPVCEEDFEREATARNHFQKAHGGDSRVEKECPVCSSTFHAKPSQSNRRVTCSRKCAGRYRCEKYGGEDHPLRDRVDIECEWCGEAFEAKPANQDIRRFCSHQCKGEWRSETGSFSGENNPRWKGGYEPYYGENWQSQREKALKRDGYECRNCGLSQDESKSAFGRGLSVHHIRPIREFDSPSKANILDNLVTFCQSCHQKYEGLPIVPVKAD